MKKAKRILALIGVIFLVAMYLSTLIFSLIDSPLASDLLKGSVAATILVPVVLYGFVLFSRLFGNENAEPIGNSGGITHKQQIKRRYNYIQQGYEHTDNSYIACHHRQKIVVVCLAEKV